MNRDTHSKGHPPTAPILLARESVSKVDSIWRLLKGTKQVLPPNILLAVNSSSRGPSFQFIDKSLHGTFLGFPTMPAAASSVVVRDAGTIARATAHTGSTARCRLTYNNFIPSSTVRRRWPRKACEESKIVRIAHVPKGHADQVALQRRMSPPHSGRGSPGRNHC